MRCIKKWEYTIKHRTLWWSSSWIDLCSISMWSHKYINTHLRIFRWRSKKFSTINLLKLIKVMPTRLIAKAHQFQASFSENASRCSCLKRQRSTLLIRSMIEEWSFDKEKKKLSMPNICYIWWGNVKWRGWSLRWKRSSKDKRVMCLGTCFKKKRSWWKAEKPTKLLSRFHHNFTFWFFDQVSNSQIISFKNEFELWNSSKKSPTNFHHCGGTTSRSSRVRFIT